ncbi:MULTISPECIES: mycothiol transferase [unclassified Nocardioides]|uniref:mycothiol transferase n=1 Tax=unclassified Nocardioides TaxID=2615069 RepID=UPI0006F92F63|nr:MULTISPECIES: DUF664 domain-containing protein [unclassified Nocardioides]KQY64656.1 hypothetical protein ASD30_07055 [Nocardioides sp. Root140]KRF12559.1 hypothetical protein ASH02_13410 [Nocardioides sp. Soil796]
MNTAALLIDAFTRSRDGGLAVVDGLTEEQLAHRVGPDANSIAWLLWHLTRVQDDHVADVAGLEQVWTAQDFVTRFALPFPAEDTGYGHTSEQVASVRADADLLSSYLSAVHAQTTAYVEGLGDDDLDRVVDTRWDPPVTLGVRLVSVLDDDAQHIGQAAFVRGLVQAP